MMVWTQTISMSLSSTASKETRGRRVPRPDIEVGAGQEREWPGSSALATDCVLNFVSLANRILAYGVRIAIGRGIPSVAAFNVLTILHGEGGPLLPSTIAERMVVTRGTVTGVLGTLEQRGFIERSTDERDGRIRPVTITAAGIARVLEILPLLHDGERRWMEALSVPQQRQLLGLVARIQSNAPDRAGGGSDG
jgi:DNA-binding MarR family transcriptional regulator